MNTRLTRICFAVAALLLGSLAAQAADLPQPSYKAPAYVGPSYANWTGFYVGLNGGYGLGTSDWDVPAVSTDPSGAVYGGTIGYNFQTGTWVWGLEGDFDGTSMKGSIACGGFTCESKLPWLATGRLRLGYAGWNNWLPYITGGGAYGDVKASTPFGDCVQEQIRLDRRCRPRMGVPRQLERQGRISLRRSRLVRLRLHLWRHPRQRQLPVVDRARWA